MDTTPAAIQTAGVGRYARELLRELVQLPGDDQYYLVTAASDQDCRELLRKLPPGAWRELRRLPARERVMTALWQRLRMPVTVERLAGDFDLFHGTDFVVAPTRKPAVVTVHDLSYLHLPEYAQPELAAYLAKAVPRTLRRADAVITVSAAVAAEVAHAYPFVADRLVAIPNGVNVPDHTVEKDEGGCPTILTVGTIEPRKNHLVLLDAMSTVWDTYPDAELIVAGRIGWQAEEIVGRLRAAANDHRVTWHETVDDSELERLYARATVFVYPSRYEGFGLPVLEAMARGVPVVTSTAAALTETAGDAALFSEPDDAEQLASRIVALLDDAGKRHEMIQRGYDRVTRFSWRETARRTYHTYRKVMEGAYR